MTFEVLTIFPEIIRSYISESIIKRALQRGIIEVDIYNIRDFTVDRHHKVDDYPYGGGAGMVLKPDPIFNT
ncbi:MAG TPA: tRNA (guanosine(37)-N1)-methyltransferase TrmD, partial [Nitrospirae bacterium]|nr:tRNA (guanosine(37)-N1)-methyltransferase TrmD [Nitrospirota bacterium]